ASSHQCLLLWLRPGPTASQTTSHLLRCSLLCLCALITMKFFPLSFYLLKYEQVKVWKPTMTGLPFPPGLLSLHSVSYALLSKVQLAVCPGALPNLPLCILDPLNCSGPSAPAQDSLGPTIPSTLGCIWRPLLCFSCGLLSSPCL
ncbi:hypothetical protein H1C71_021077, partial [Ictidomys tridecemlineatus]